MARRKKRNWSLHDIYAPGWGWGGGGIYFYQDISLGHQEKSHGEISLGDHENSHGETKNFTPSPREDLLVSP